MSENAAIDPAVMTLGKQSYMMCGACHGQQGEGTPIAPPIAGSEWVTGPAENLIRIQMRGLTGPIEVKGKVYNPPAPMAPMGTGQSDENVAAVLTYIRNSFGNSAPAVTAEMVKPFRSEIGKPMLTVKDLKDPKLEKKEPQDKPKEPVISTTPLTPLPEISAKSALGASGWGVAAFLIIGGLCVFGMLRMKVTSK